MPRDRLGSLEIHGLQLQMMSQYSWISYHIFLFHFHSHSLYSTIFDSSQTPATPFHQAPLQLRKLRPYSRNSIIYQFYKLIHIFIHPLLLSSCYSKCRTPPVSYDLDPVVSCATLTVTSSLSLYSKIPYQIGSSSTSKHLSLSHFNNSSNKNWTTSLDCISSVLG